MMSTVRCSFCHKVAEEALSIRHRDCGHATHADCLPTDRAPNYKLCAQCSGGEYQSLAATPSLSLDDHRRRPAAEPHTNDNIDYILNPGTKKPAPTAVGGLVSKLWSSSSSSSAKGPETIETSTDPMFLLNHRVPIEDIMHRNGLGLDHFCRAGIELRDFLRNGYTWRDLLKFEDIGRGGVRAIQAVAIGSDEKPRGLKGTANDFRIYPDAFPYAEVRAHLKFAPHQLNEHFGLRFPPNGPLECMGDQRGWTATRCVEMGLTMDDLFDMGLTYVQQYEDLMSGIGAREAAEAERKLGVDIAKHQARLMDYHEADALAEEQARIPIANCQGPEEEQEEEVESQINEHIYHPPPAAMMQATHRQPAAAAAVVIRHQTPRRTAANNNNKPTNAVPVAVQIAHQTPQAMPPLKPSYQERSRRVAQRHGLLVPL